MSKSRMLAAAVATSVLVGALLAGAAPAVAAGTPTRPACAAQEPISIGSSGMMRTWENVLLQDAGEWCQLRGTLDSYYWKGEEIVETVTPNYAFWARYQYINGQWTLYGNPS